MTRLPKASLSLPTFRFVITNVELEVIDSGDVRVTQLGKTKIYRGEEEVAAGKLVNYRILMIPALI